MKLTRIHNQPSWQFNSDLVEAAVTQQSGHLGPVKFKLPHGVIAPYAVAPWAEEKPAAKGPPILRSLRGDFFCLPFGGNDTAFRGEQHLVHGEPANADWKFESLRREETETELHLSLETKVRRGRVDKFIRLRNGETALYCQHVISGMSGKMSFGHHPTLKFPDAEGSGLISTSPISFGQVTPVAIEDPAKGGYSCLKLGAQFKRLDRVAASDGTVADLSRYPARRGFEDVALIVHQASPDFAWLAATFLDQRYVYFALKDPRVLQSTVFWISNGGRHYAPWNGRHTSVLGIEDVTAYFACGLAESVQPNSLSRRGIATHVDLKPGKPFVVNYIMGVAAMPKGWGRVKTITRNRQGITLKSAQGSVHVPVDVDFLYSKNP